MPIDTLALISGPLAQISFNTVGSFVGFFIGLSLVVFVHELGHFLVAKWCDVRVMNFAIGFGPELLGFTRGETRYSFRAFPLGGYVKMLGQEDFTIDKEGELALKNDPRSYTSKPVSQRMMVVSAGVVMNIVFAAVFFMVAFMMGMESVPAKVGLVLPDRPAFHAGLRPGDQIVSIDGHTTREWQDVLMRVALSDPGQTLTMVLRGSDGKERTAYVEPQYNAADRLRRIGVRGPEGLRIADMGGADSNAPDQLHLDDKIVALEGKPVSDVNEVLMAIAAAEGRPVQITVERQVPQMGPDGKVAGTQTEKVNVQRRAHVALLPADNPNLLGASPRLRIGDADPKGPAYQAGLRAGDVIVQWDGIVNPTWKQILGDVSQYPNTDQPVWVLRDGEVEPRMFLVHPQAPFRLTGGGPPQPGIERNAGEIDDQHLVLAHVLKDSPMGRSGLQAGDRITALADQDVSNWEELVRELKHNAGKTVEITHLGRDGSKEIGQLQIPRSLYAELGLTSWPQSVVISVNGQKTVQARQEDRSLQEYSVSIPEGMRIALQQNVGKTIPIEYQIGDQVKTADFQVTPDALDPWYMQVQFVEPFSTWPEMILLQTRNPITALDWGVRRTWYLVVSTYVTIKQMLFTQQIGVEHLSGPVGIVRIGTQVAESGLPQLIYFLAFLSANFAVVNFLPFPIVDGGHFMFLLIEKIKGKPLSVRVQMVTQVIGLAMILGAFAFLTLQDIIMWNKH